MEPVPRAQWDRWKHQFVYLSPVGPESGPDWWSCIKSACCIRNIWGFPKIRRPDSVWCCSCHIKPVERDGALTQLMEQSLHSAASSLLFLDSGDKIGSSFSVSSRSGGQKWRPQRFISSPCVTMCGCCIINCFSSMFENRNIPQTFASWCFCFNLQIFGTHLILHLSWSNVHEVDSAVQHEEA